MKKIKLFTKYSRLGASSRMRMYNYEGYLSGSYAVDISCLLTDEYVESIYSGGTISKRYLFKMYLTRFLNFIRSLFSVDCIWIEKELFPWIPLPIEVMVKFFGVKLAFDFDDAVYSNYYDSKFSRLYSWKFRCIAKYADLIVCGNDVICDFFKKNGCVNVVLIPTVIDIDKYSCRNKHLEFGKVVIGWIGTPNTQKFLKVVDKVICELQSEFDVDFHLIGAKVDSTLLSSVKIIDWTEATEVDSLNQIDIGIMPLFDGEFEKGKCGYKLIQYMALSKPVVASPIGVNINIVNHKVNGFLCITEQEWYDALKCLILNKSLRLSYGENGLDMVLNRFTYQIQAVNLNNELAKLFDDVK